MPARKRKPPARRRTPARSSSSRSSRSSKKGARVAILMGSKDDGPTMKAASDVLSSLGVETDVRIMSVHRTPQRHHDYVTTAEERGIEIFICGAGFSAHLAGVTAALTQLPVLGVPLEGSALNGVDALYSTVNMPGGIPVATFTIGKEGAKNAGLFAASILANSDAQVKKNLAAFRAKQTAGVPERP